MRILVIVCVALLMIGCSGTHYYKPDPSTFKMDAVPELSSSSHISLVNVQKSSDQVLFAMVSNHEWFGNLQEWTDVAIEIVQRELANRDMTVINDAPKMLNISIEDATYTSTFWTLTVIVTMTVETSDGYLHTYKGTNSSPATITRAADGAVMRVVAEMLRDKEIITYLEK